MHNNNGLRRIKLATFAIIASFMLCSLQPAIAAPAAPSCGPPTIGPVAWPPSLPPALPPEIQSIVNLLTTQPLYTLIQRIPGFSNFSPILTKLKGYPGSITNDQHLGFKAGTQANGSLASALGGKGLPLFTVNAAPAGTTITVCKGSGQWSHLNGKQFTIPNSSLNNTITAR